MHKCLWKPGIDFVEASNMYAFLQYVNESHHTQLSCYADLYRWSVTEIEDFWDSLWHFLDIKCSQPYTSVVDDLKKFPGAEWFPGARMNYAENILRDCDRDDPAILFRCEEHTRRVLSRRALKTYVQRLALSLRKAGIGPGDVVAAYMPNIPETVIAMLAAMAVGAAWCSCATDIGAGAAIDRLGQTAPKILFTADGYFYKGKAFDVLKNAAEVADGIASLEKVVITHYAGDPSQAGNVPNSVMIEDFLEEDIAGFVYEQVPASQLAVIMFSSGTTGRPKCMAQSAGGLLINQLKEITIHGDVKPADRMLYITTCSWMMWNWMAAALGAGASLVLYDGSPSFPDTAQIWRVLEEEQVTFFGLSASYVHSLLKEGFSPKNTVDLHCLRHISQTGSALSAAGFDYIYNEIKADLHFSSIAGGTDINGCFAIGNPLSPVYSGELQAPGLGMKIECYDDSGNPIRDKEGELVCEAPAPSMPLYFWNDPDNDRYRDAYFRVYPDVWRHGDYVIFNSETGGVTFCGRSDSVLKPSGVRIGTAEIYNQVESLPEIVDSLAIGQTRNNDQRILLFVLLQDGCILDDRLKADIRHILKTNASPRHVPSVILQVPDIPRTLNGKKVESAVTNIINGRSVTNREALSNPNSLDFFEHILPELQ